MRRRVLLLFAALLTVACSKDPQVARTEFLEKGNRFLAQGKSQEAIVEYRNALQQDPRYAEARIKLSQAYEQAGNQQEAFREAVRAADLLPDDVAAQVRAGQFLLLFGQFEDAKTRSEKALFKDPKSTDALIVRANAMAGLKDLGGALKEMESAIALDPKQAASYANLGALQMKRGNPIEAENAFRRAVAADPKSLAAQLALGNYLWTSGRQAEAESVMKQALTLAPDDPLANQALAVFYLSSSRAADAEPHLKRLADKATTPAARLALADFYIQTGRGPDAEKALAEAAGQPGGFAPARARVAAMRYAAGKSAEAHQAIDEVLKAEPNNVEALLVKARFLAGDGRLPDAVSTARAATTADPSSVEAQFLVGKLLVQRNEVDAAITAFREVLRLNPSALAAQVEVARLELSRGQRDASLAAAQDARAAGAGDPMVRLVAARALLANGKFDEADAEMKMLVAAAPNAAVVHAQYGTLYLLKRDLTAARRSFARALDLDPLSAEALSGLVAADMREGKASDAMARIEKRLATSPQDSTAQVLASMINTVQGRHAEAESWLRKAIAADPSKPRPYGMLAESLFHQGKLDQARDEFDGIAARKPGDVAAPTMAAMIVQAQGKAAEAQQRYEKIVANNPRAALASNNLAWMYAEQNQKLDTALNLAQAAKAEDPESASFNDTLGFVYLKMKLGELAVPPLRIAVEKEPENPGFHARLGQAYALTGDKVRARQELERALKLKPDFAGADEAKKVLASLGS